MSFLVKVLYSWYQFVNAERDKGNRCSRQNNGEPLPECNMQYTLGMENTYNNMIGFERK